MNTLPLDIKNIVNDYRYHIEYQNNIKSSLDIIKYMGQSNIKFSGSGFNNNEYYETDWIQVYKDYNDGIMYSDFCIKCGEFCHMKNKCGCNILFRHSWYKEYHHDKQYKKDYDSCIDELQDKFWLIDMPTIKFKKTKLKKEIKKIEYQEYTNCYKCRNFICTSLHGGNYCNECQRLTRVNLLV